MSKATSWQEILQFLLSGSTQCETAVEFFEHVLPKAQQFVGAEAAAIVRSTPPSWQIATCSGCSPENVPTSLAAAALDLGDFQTQGHWSGSPLSDKLALLVRGSVPQDKLAQLQSALTEAFENVRRHQQGARRIRRLERILEITHAWSQTNCMEALLQAMAETACELLGADRASIFLWDRASKTLVGRPALGFEDNELRIPDNTGIVGQVIQSGKPRRVGDGLDEDQISRTIDKETGYDTKTLLCVPLCSPDGKLLGAFEVLNKREGRFTEEDERGLLELASHAAVALENTQQVEQLLNNHQLLVEEAAEGVQMIGDSPVIQAVRSTVQRIADTDLAILILGENGTGKEVVARMLHYLSSRRDQPFIAVNCAALSETLLESELFGHEKGAFTDAHQARPGKFELASGGTLFLDEIGDMSPGGQAKLLRVLEEKSVVRVGGSATIYTEVRIVAATNQDLARMVREKKFREDLYFRLNVVSLDLPPLRERGDDVLMLAEHFLETFCRNMGRTTPKFSAVARKQLLTHAWPGNVRELRNLMERLAYLSSGERIEAEDLAFIDTGTEPSCLEGACTLSDATKEFQQRYIRQMIELAKGNMSQTAKRLGLHRSNLYRKMRQLDMNVGERDPGPEEDV